MYNMSDDMHVCSNLVFSTMTMFGIIDEMRDSKDIRRIRLITFCIPHVFTWLCFFYNGSWYFTITPSKCWFPTLVYLYILGCFRIFIMFVGFLCFLCCHLFHAIKVSQKFFHPGAIVLSLYPWYRTKEDSQKLALNQ